MDNIIEFDQTTGLRFFHGRGKFLKKLTLNVHFETRSLLEMVNDNAIYKVILDDINRIHSTTEPAYTISNDKTTFVERWYFEGQLHRSDGPSIIRNTVIDPLKREYAWYWHGKVCGSTNSTEVKDAPKKYLDLRNDHTSGLTESYTEKTDWFKEVVPGHKVYYKSDKGAYHRTDGGPAIIEPKYLSWRQGGTFYRKDNLPNVIDNREGVTEYKWLTRRGLLHRLAGPAIEEGDNYHWYINSTLVARSTKNNPLNVNQLIRHIRATKKEVWNTAEKEKPSSEQMSVHEWIDTMKFNSLNLARMIFEGAYITKEVYEKSKAVLLEEYEKEKADMDDLLRKLKS